MSAEQPYYNETTDLYWQMLSEARRIEDQNLARMIRSRLKKEAAVRKLATGGDNIIAFPGSWTACLEPDKEHEFWKDQKFWSDMIQFLMFLSVGLGWFLFFMSLLSEKMVRIYGG